MNAVGAIVGAWFRFWTDIVRVLLMVLLFRPAAYVLPRALIWPLALACAFPLVLVSAEGRHTAREFRFAYGLTRLGGWRLAVRNQARRFEEFAWMQKLKIGLVQPETRPVTIEASPETLSAIKSNGSLIVAQAHFVRDSPGIAVYSPPLFDRRAIVVAMKPPEHNFHPKLLRVRIQLKQLLSAAPHARHGRLKVTLVGKAFSSLLADLEQERALVTINVDAHWRSGRSSSLTRPFAGALERTYSTGAAKLARLAGAPLLYVQSEVVDDGKSILMRIAGPFSSDAQDPEVRDQEATGKLLDHIEKEVGKQPERYVLDIGGQRRWDARQQEWRPI
jgi:hypothetical protein